MTQWNKLSRMALIGATMMMATAPVASMAQVKGASAAASPVSSTNVALTNAAPTNATPANATPTNASPTNAPGSTAVPANAIRITAVGTGIVETPADWATLTIRVHAQANSQAEADRKAKAAEQRIRAIAERHGMKAGDIKIEQGDVSSSASAVMAVEAAAAAAAADAAAIAGAADAAARATCEAAGERDCNEYQEDMWRETVVTVQGHPQHITAINKEVQTITWDDHVNVGTYVSDYILRNAGRAGQDAQKAAIAHARQEAEQLATAIGYRLVRLDGAANRVGGVDLTFLIGLERTALRRNEGMIETIRVVELTFIAVPL